MNKIGILTFHFADNFGAVLQSYALNKVLNSIDGYNAKIINLIPSYFRYEQRWSTAYEKKCFLKKRKIFNDFLEHYCNITEKCSFVDNTTFDIYCVGSDQLWNTENVFKEYFLYNIPDDKRKISYATSIALSNESPYLREDIFKEYVSRFDSISVREEESVEYITKTTNKKCIRACDPTLLLDIKEYDELCIENEDIGEYILLFWLLNDENEYVGIEFANRLSHEKNLPIIHSLYGKYENYIVNNKGSMFYVSPGKFLNYIKNASYIVTNSYHATLFALRYEKNIYIHLVKSMESRFKTLFSLYDIQNCLIDRHKFDYIKNVEIDYKSVRQEMLNEKHRGMEYLIKALKENN